MKTLLSETKEDKFYTYANDLYIAHINDVRVYCRKDADIVASKSIPIDITVEECTKEEFMSAFNNCNTNFIYGKEIKDQVLFHLKLKKTLDELKIT